MEITVKFKLSDSWEANTVDSSQIVKELLRSDLDGVESEILEVKMSDNFVKCDEFGEIGIASRDIYPCSICRYDPYSASRVCVNCIDNLPTQAYYK